MPPMSPDCPNPALPATLPADDPSPAQEAGAVPARRASEAQQRHDRLMREIEQLRERLQHLLPQEANESMAAQGA